ncbi:MAG: CHC2 zinc finger domain-containing protein [Paludibacteraceae bacterium]|nr:CHC2 zinc finger domain-containing protein [Paludibacteraceae bacterium]
MILRSDIDRVLDVARIEDVVEEDLTRYGKNLRCCCPFHTEKTPSFVVFPARNSYKCFGCGKYGHPVDYLMEKHGYSFPQAIKQLADRYKITLTEEEETPEEKAKRRDEDNRRQLMINTYQRVQQFFVRNIREDNPEALAALSYATKRWGVDFVDAYGIGYAYNDFHKLKDWAKEKHLSEQILIELGLLAESEDKSHTYDFFRGRVMIPIRSASQLIIAYTARYVPASKGSTPKGDKEPPKYLNSKNSLLYSKDKSVFGLDVARQYGASEDKFYLMEGGPDVLRLQYLEINNAVASLGSDWTEHQLQQLQRYAHTLCFIPDIDPPKAGEKYGTGIKKVMKFGEKCLAMGFDKVLVKEITSSDKSKSTKGKKPEKMDADSYFQTKNKFDMVSEENFIVWYAAKLSAMHGDDTEHNVSEVARLLSYVKTEYQVNIIIDEITPYIKATKKTWTDAITNAKCNLTKDLIRQKRDKDIDGEQLEQYGFIEKNHCYVTVGEKGKTYEWSNFVLKPLFHIKDATASSRIFKITNMYGTSEVIELKQEDLASRVKFATKVESLGNFLWLAKDEQLTSLKRYLYKATDTAYLIHKLGWQKRTLFYAFGNGIFDGAVWHAADEYGIVKLNEGTLEQRNYYLPSASTIRDDSEKSESDFEHQFIHTTYGSFSMEEYISRLVDSFGDNAKVAYAFLLATVFRDVIAIIRRCFRY